MKYFILGTVLLFGTIAFLGWKNRQEKPEVQQELIQEIALGTLAEPIQIPTMISEEVPEIDRIDQLFTLDRAKQLPIVETVSFTSRVPWMKDRPAWIADYASHFQTSRHFIARSLNKKADYLTQKVHPGDRFNVFKKDKDIRFHLLVDLSRCTLWFYYLDGAEKVLLKTYRVGLGKKDPVSASGYLTPLGKYELGDRIVTYKPGAMGNFQDGKIEMIRVFGTRWIPFEKELGGCTEPAKGLGIHGAPWIEGSGGQLVEDRSKIGKYDSDGCVRLCSEDIEEIFSIVVTKPTTVEIVKELPGGKP